MNKIRFFLRALIFVARDILIGFLVAVSATVLLAKVKPDTYRVIALLIPIGVAAGLLKGIVKFVFLNISSALPSKGYRYDYPKYRLLAFWLTVLFGSLLIVYGIDISSWVSDPINMLTDNIILGITGIGKRLWLVFAALIFILGITAHFYEPPYNDNETLPPEEPEEGEPTEVK